MGISGAHTTLLVVTLAICSAATALGAVYSFRRIRLPRPAVGVFNDRDAITIIAIIVAIPLLYLVTPAWLLTVFLTVVFGGILLVAYRPVVSRWVLWPVTVALLAGSMLTNGEMASQTMVVVHWVVNSVLVILGVVGAANINAQGGMRLRHAVVFAVVLGIYDWFFAWVVPLTPKVMHAFGPVPLAPAAGMRLGEIGAFIGTGDLLVYALFAATAYKAYRGAGLRMAMVTIVIFGGVIPALIPALADALNDQRVALVPAQVIFAPAALVGYLILRRRGPEAATRDQVQPVRVPASTAEPGVVPSP